MNGRRVPGKLSNAAEFQRVRKQGKLYRAQGFDFVVLKRDDDGGPRLGLVVSRRVGGAVVRNRWKRLIRTYVRLHSADFGCIDLVVIPRQPPPSTLWDFADRFEKIWHTSGRS